MLEKFAHAVAWELKQRDSKAKEFAWIVHEAEIYFSGFSGLPGSPTSAVIKLIQGIFDQKIDLSFFILRKRIWTTQKATSFDRAIVSLAAKRITDQVKPERELQDAILSAQWVEIGETTLDFYPCKKQVLLKNIDLSSMIASEVQAAAYVAEMIRGIPRGPVLHDHNRPIAALAWDEQGRILGAAVNENSRNKTLHAEVKLVQEYWLKFGNKFPDHTTVMVSLKPCKMCSAALSLMSEGVREFRVFYIEDDLGPKSRQTSLELEGKLFRWT